MLSQVKGKENSIIIPGCYCAFLHVSFRCGTYYWVSSVSNLLGTC